jgi:hypothetical protein
VNTISASGTYNVTVTNNSGCSATVSQIVNMPNVTGAVFGALSGCGTVVLTANTIPGATYTWSSGATPNAISNAVSTTGIYTVTITINSCSVSTTRSVTVYGLPNATVVSENASCNSGSSVLTATGGTTYTWASGLSTTTAVNTVNGSGTYTVTVSNGNGCSATASFTVNAIPSPQIAGNTTSCGSIALNAYYGNSYLWSGGTSTNTAANTVTSGGTYTVTATSAAGCTATASITVAINPAPIVTITGNSTGCGNAIMTASGGNSYLWSSGFTPTTAVNTVTNAGNYTVTVTDANGCTAASTFAVTAVNTAVNPIIKGNSYGCTSTILTATGGNTYVWSGGVASTTPGVATFNTSGTYTVTITRTAGGCTATASRVVTIGGAVQAQIATSNNATCSSLTLTASGGSTYAWSNGGTGASKLNVASGTYTVTATTATCGTGTASITVNTTAVIATITSPATACGNASLTATGGISYAWSNNTVAATNNVLNGGTYTVTATAANGCTASATKAITIGNAYAAISGLNTACGTLTLTASGGTTYAWTGGGTTAAKAITASGTYTVTVTSSTCTATASKTVTILAKPTVTMAASAIGCGRATLTVTPLPAAVYTYTWASGRNTTATATNVVATGGTYNVTVTNANGCTAATNLLVTIPSVTAGIAGVSSTCGSITLTAYSNGGTPAYAWTGGTATAIKTITANGTYTVTVTATFPSGVCSATASQTVTLKPAATASIAASATTACNSLNLTASGGGYYAWSGGIAPTSAVNTIITSSTYTVTVTNSAGCTATSTKAVVINTPPTAGITGVTTACSQVQLTAAGNFGSTYAWSGGGTTAAKIITTNGIYTVTVTQGACGTATASRTVTINTPPTMVSIAEISIVANATTLSATSTGGVYYAWNSGYTPTAAVNTVYISATYVVTVTNINGCSATASLGVIISPIDPFLIAPTTHGNIPQSNTIENSKNDATASSTAIAAINNITPSNMVSVYPNPITDDVLQVKINLSSEETVAKIDFIDLYGKLIATQTMTLKQGENTLEFNVKNLTAGIYFVKTTATGQEFETKKVLKMRH